MSVRKRKWRDKQGRQHETWMVHVHHTWPDGRKQSIRKVSPVQTKRGAEQYEREIRAQLLSGDWKGGHKKQTPTLEDFAEEFLAYQATLNKPTELELVALRWREDVDLDRRRVRVQQSYHPVNGFSTTKNDRIREIPLTWDATEALRTQWSRVDGEYVFPGVGGGVLDGSVSNDALARISAAIEMRGGITNHTMRHSFASQAVMRGIPIRQVQEWLGHHSVVVTMRYAHLARGVGDELIQRLSPDPAPEDGPKSRSGAARSRHTDSTRNRPKSKSAIYTGKKGRS